MSRPLPENLQRVYRMIGEDAAARMHAGHAFHIDGIEFVTGYIPESTAERFYIVKSRELLALYDEFLERRSPRRIFELGIAEGGSTAMMALRADLERLVAIDNEEHRLPALDEMISARGLEDRVRAYYGVDQADRAKLRSIMETDFADGPIDLVIDDASHDYELTKASFDILLPHVRPGGWYLVEDWSQHLKVIEAVRQAPLAKGETAPRGGAVARDAAAPPPLERLALEWLAAVGAWPGAIDRVEANHLFVAVRRGPEELDPDTFALDTYVGIERLEGLLPPPADG